jgi:hypothetical protein
MFLAEASRPVEDLTGQLLNLSGGLKKLLAAQ